MCGGRMTSCVAVPGKKTCDQNEVFELLRSLVEATTMTLWQFANLPDPVFGNSRSVRMSILNFNPIESVNLDGQEPLP